MYTDLSKRHRLALKGSAKDDTVTIRQFVLTLKEYSVFESLPSLTIPKILESFIKLYPFLLDCGSYNLEHEVFSFEQSWLPMTFSKDYCTAPFVLRRICFLDKYAL
jgi:hypothetical protein